MAAPARSLPVMFLPLPGSMALMSFGALICATGCGQADVIASLMRRPAANPRSGITA